MSQNVVAERYALALFQLAKEQNVIQKVEEELRVIQKVMKANPNFITLLNTPNLSIDVKKSVVKDVFTNVSPLILNVLMLLVDRQRQNEITDVTTSYIQLANEELGIADASVYTVRPLKAEEIKAISSTFSTKVGKSSLNIENIVDSNLLGGLKIRIGNRIFDGSLRGKLDRLERTITT